ncbi:SubName: Full=Uncharacterized protein {ECO:0000313/EMBL:CCA73941.1} [Serendipita indica DSM 11827]|nr:SubName: Full=Uncharacterized protein {ECO:0000313/EMBL:CCA73941.1} [Serendipita indica DSM 11827]
MSGVAMRSGDTWNGASIATWWAFSHVIFASITKSTRKEIAKKTGKPLARPSPLAWVVTSASLATGLAYGVTL